MRKMNALALFFLLLFAPAALAAEEVPKTLAGMTLGESVHNYMQLCNMRMASTIPDLPFLSEVHLDPFAIPGIRGGSMTYANSTPGKELVRIKLKFHDKSQDLFEELLAEYKEKFGDPDSYRGDTFRNVIAWQWDFAKRGERVSLLLMWSRDPQLRPGVSIKMTFESLFKKEYKDFKTRYDRSARGKKGEEHFDIRNIDEFVPR